MSNSLRYHGCAPHFELQTAIPANREHCLRRGLQSILVLLTFAILSAAPSRVRAQVAGNGSQAVASASATAAASSTGKLTFDAASLRTSTRRFYLIGADFLDPASNMAPPKGGLFSWNLPLVFLIDFAYDIRPSQSKGGVWEQLPKWAQDEWYAVEARAEGNPTRDDVRQMVRSLLEERFKLAVHKTTVDGQIYSLVVVKPGLGLKPHPEGAPCAVSLPRPVFAYPSYDQVPVHCGVFDRSMGPHDEKRRLELLDVTMQQIADMLTRTGLALPVHDETGLTGNFDAVLDYGPSQLPPDNDSAYEVGTPVPGALEKQLGLKLVKKAAPLETFTVDHIERPSDN